MATVETITARLEADTRQFEQAMGQASVTTGELQGTFRRAEGGTHALRRGINGLALELTNTTGPAGHLALGLMNIVGDSTLVVAGIATIALALHEMTRETRENAAAQEVLAKSLDGLGPHAAIAAAKIRLAAAQAKLEESGPLVTLWRGIKGIFGKSPAEQSEALEQEIATLEGLIGRLSEAFEKPWVGALRASNVALQEAELRFRMVADPMQDVDQAVKTLSLELDKYPSKTAATIAANERLAKTTNLTTDAWRDSLTRLGEANTKMRMLGASTLDVNEALERQRMINKGVSPEQATLIAATDKLAASRERIAAKFQQVFGDLDTQMIDIGAQLGRDIVEGLMSGMLKMDDIMKRFVISFMSANLWGMIGHVVGSFINQGAGVGGGSATFGVDSGGGAMGQPSGSPMSGGSLGAASFAIQTAGVLAAPTTPFAVMRDAEWQRYLRGSLILARKDGFRP